MLKSLQIKDYALIEDLTIDFNSQLNIFTGETGAGKSIIVDALMLLFGERASNVIIRNSSPKSIIEGLFSIERNHLIFEIPEINELDINDTEFYIRREILRKGTSRSFINDTPVQLGLLKKVGELLVDFHGQYDHQSLLKTENHIKILDETGSYQNIISIYKKLFADLKYSINQLYELFNKEKEIIEKSEFLTNQYQAILKVNPDIDEDIKLLNELKLLENAETLHNFTTSLINIAEGYEYSLISQLININKILNELSQIEHKFTPYLNEIESFIISLNEITRFTESYQSSIIYDEQRIEDIRHRLTEIRNLVRKYGSIKEIIERIETELNSFESLNYSIEQTKQKIRELKRQISEVSHELSEQRIIHSKDFSKSIIQNFKTLGMENGDFKINIIQELIDDSHQELKLTVELNNSIVKLFSDGIDKTEFFLSTNKGEAPKPLADVASGGEISRIMLAIKSVIAKSDSIKLMVFDEIDIGISGRIAQRVGQMMKKLAEHKQIIAITHLPQIAAFGDNNFRVLKIEQNGKTYIQAENLDYKNKIYEIARLISGENITEAAIIGAEQLTEEALKYGSTIN